MHEEISIHPEKHISTKAQRAQNLLEEVGLELEKRDICFEKTVHVSHDVHGFYRFKQQQDLVVHLQAYPGLSNKAVVMLTGRIMSYERMMAIRSRDCAPSKGNEHEAVVSDMNGLPSGSRHDWDAQQIVDLIVTDLKRMLQ